MMPAMIRATSGAGAAMQSRASLGLAAAALRSGNVAGARQMLHDRLLADPLDADALELLAEIAAGERAFEDSTILLQRAVAADPAPRRRLVLVDHLRRHVSPALALHEVEQLPETVRGQFEVMAMEAALTGALGLNERQIALYRAMVRQRPSSPGVWVSLGNALKTVGRTEEAVKALRRALRAEPAFGEAWWTLANFKSFRFSARDLAEMRAALRRRLADSDALHIHFALGKAHEDRGEYEQSFRHYAAGNAIRAAGSDPDQAGVSALVDQSIATFTSDFFARNRTGGCAEEGPIFVVGLHRSGSTLIEQILASHPLVEGTTELTVMKSIRDRITRSSGASPAAAVAALEPSDFRRIGEEYLERTKPFRRTDRPFFVDKLPGNWTNLPLIRAALPNARIVDARRHPLACGFSNFKQNYASGVGFSYSLATIGAFYRDYWRFMRHFESVQPSVACRMINERLIEQPEAEVRRMLAHLRLPFEPSCLEFHKNARAVQTPSAEQVRRPINRDGVEQWRHYEPWLDELKASLGEALDRWED
jgi:tetratricopeptide (TPR) repeat protein